MIRVLGIAVLLTTTAYAEDVGWSVGSGGKTYGGARTACEAFLKDTASGGVTYVIERMESTAAGDQTCWFKNTKDDGKAVTQTLIYRVRRTTYEGIPMFRGTSVAKRREATTLEHDLGPGVYYYKEQWVARAYAQAAFLDAYTDRGTTPPEKVPDGIVYEYDFKAPKELFDFSQGKLLAEFEKVACKELTPPVAERMFNGEVNPVQYYKAFVAFAKTKSKKPADYKHVIGPDYRHSIAGNGQQDPELHCDTKPEDRLTRRQPQMRINDKGESDRLEKKAMQSLETRFPSKEDIAAALVGHRTNVLFTRCTPSAKEGSCKDWTFPAGKLIYMRRKWQSVIHHQKATKGQNANHYHLRVGPIIVDGTFVQFDGAAANDDDKAELFVGSREELIQRLDNFSKPEGGMSGKKLVETFWDAKPLDVGGVVPRVAYRPSGEVDWNP